MADALRLLRALAASHERMAAQADALDWNGLQAEWQKAQRDFAELARCRLPDLPAHQRAEAERLMQELLDRQRHIAARAEPWMEQVRPLLESFRQYPIKAGG